jgi:exopolysaccharide biosynthesis protein
MPRRIPGTMLAIALLLICTSAGAQPPEQSAEQPYAGITLIHRSIIPPDLPRAVNMKILQIDLTAPGIRFKLSPPAGTLEVVTQTTLDFLIQEGAQLAVNVHFYLPVGPSETNLIGLAVSNGNVYSGFETPAQSYAIVDYAPAINIDPDNHVLVVHPDRSFADGKHILEKTKLRNAVSGSAQIVADGVKTIPVYRDAAHPEGTLTSGNHYSNDPPQGPNLGSWYDVPNPRTAIGLSRDNQTLIILTADGRGAGGSWGLTGSEMADILINDYRVYNALNLDGGGSTTLAMKNPVTGAPGIINFPSDTPARSVGSSLAIFAERK